MTEARSHAGNETGIPDQAFNKATQRLLDISKINVSVNANVIRYIYHCSRAYDVSCRFSLMMNMNWKRKHQQQQVTAKAATTTTTKAEYTWTIIFKKCDQCNNNNNACNWAQWDCSTMQKNTRPKCTVRSDRIASLGLSSIHVHIGAGRQRPTQNDAATWWSDSYQCWYGGNVGIHHRKLTHCRFSAVDGNEQKKNVKNDRSIAARGIVRSANDVTAECLCVAYTNSVSGWTYDRATSRSVRCAIERCDRRKESGKRIPKKTTYTSIIFNEILIFKYTLFFLHFNSVFQSVVWLLFGYLLALPVWHTRVRIWFACRNIGFSHWIVGCVKNLCTYLLLLSCY